MLRNLIQKSLGYGMTVVLVAASTCWAVDSDYGDITLLRDVAGTPHIFADSDRDALYGLGYATAEDRLFQMTLNLRVIQGRLAETLGDIPLRDGRESAVEHDRKMRLFGYYRSAEHMVAALDADTRELLQAYADGVNAYLAEHAEKLPELFEDHEITPEPWRVADCIASWHQLARFFGGEGLHATMAYHQHHALQTGEADENNPSVIAQRAGLVIDDAAAVIQREDVDDAWLDAVHDHLAQHGLQKGNQQDKRQGEDGAPSFSHAWVVGGEKSGTGSAVLFSDPQTPVRNPSLLYEFHVSGASFNARGVGVAGSPILLIGWNERVAWGMTALAADQADQFFLRVNPEKPDQYEVDGVWQTMTARTEEILVKGGEAEAITIRETRFGPVVTALAHGTRPGEEVALKRIPQADTGHDTHQGAFAMMRARNVDALMDAVAGWRFPSANAVFGDRDGNIGYTLVGAFPVRSQYAEEGGRITQYGWESENDWQGILPAHLAPRTTNPERGYLFTANHRPIASFYPLERLVGGGAPGDTLRSWRLRQRMEGRDRITPEEVKAIHYDTVNPARKALVKIGLHLRESGAPLSEAALLALETLEAWHAAGARSEKDQPGYEVASELELMFRVMQTNLSLEYGGGASGLAHFLKSTLQAMDAESWEPTEEAIAYIDNNLASAWQRASENQPAAPASDRGAGARERATRDTAPEQQQLEYFASLYGLGSLNPALDAPTPNLICTDINTIRSQEGQAFSMWVPLHDVDQAQSVLPVSNTENPASPHYLASLEAWESGKMHPAPISRSAVEAIAVSVKTFP